MTDWHILFQYLVSRLTTTPLIDLLKQRRAIEQELHRRATDLNVLLQVTRSYRKPPKRFDGTVTQLSADAAFVRISFYDRIHSRMTSVDGVPIFDELPGSDMATRSDRMYTGHVILPVSIIEAGAEAILELWEEEQQRDARESEAHERETYARLKAKFEPEQQ